MGGTQMQGAGGVLRVGGGETPELFLSVTMVTAVEITHKRLTPSLTSFSCRMEQSQAPPGALRITDLCCFFSVIPCLPPT
jgi:hypothetical protein